MRKTGLVNFYDSLKRFGFIEDSEGAAFFFHQRYVLPTDAFLRRQLYSNDLVEFEPVWSDTKEIKIKNNVPIATNIRVQNRPKNDEVMPDDYWEVCSVQSIGKERRNGFLIRPCGDTIFFFLRDVLTYGELSPGTKVVCGFKQTPSGHCLAKDIEILIPDDEQKEEQQP